MATTDADAWRITPEGDPEGWVAVGEWWHTHCIRIRPGDLMEDPDAYGDGD